MRKLSSGARSLSSTFFGTGRGGGQNGLFQGNLHHNDEPLEWTRSQQAAFLIQLWRDVEEAVAETPTHWWIRCYGDAQRALHDKTSMLNQDMGVRALLTVSNEIFFENAEYWRLHTWDVGAGDDDEGEISSVIHVWNRRTSRYVTLPCEDERYAQGVSLWHHRRLQEWAALKGEEFSSEDDRLLVRAKMIRKLEDLAPTLKGKERRAMARLLHPPIVALDHTLSHS